MQPDTAKKLLKLNHQFYQNFADDFSVTRQRLQPGVLQVISAIPHSANLLDLGCGNGQLAAQLAGQGHTGSYIGIDDSPKLIEIARSLKLANASFFAGDLADPDWDATLPRAPFDYIFCFAVMHHIPGEDLRLAFLHKVRNLLTADGRFINSNWQFLDSQKLRARIQPWETLGLAESDVDENDHLLDWRRGGTGYRYVHHYSSIELQKLAAKCGFKVSGLFTSDGETGNLGLYQIWERE